MLEVLYKNIHLNLHESHKLTINIVLILFILGVNTYFVIERFVIKKHDPEFIQFYKDLYHDFLKYLFIESAVIISEVLETNTFNITASLGRIAFVHTALVIFHKTKWVVEDII